MKLILKNCFTSFFWNIIKIKLAKRYRPNEKIVKIKLSKLQKKLINIDIVKQNKNKLFLIFFLITSENNIIVINDGKNLNTDDDGINMLPDKLA